MSLVAHPMPNSLAQALIGLLSLLLPATLAARVFLLGLLGAGLAVALALVRQRHTAAAGAFAVVLLVSVFSNAPFWNGYVNYQLALLFFAAWSLLPPARRAEAGPILCFGLAIFFSHAAVFAAFCILVAVRGLLGHQAGAAMLGLAPSLLFTACMSSPGNRTRARRMQGSAASPPSSLTKPNRRRSSAPTTISSSPPAATRCCGRRSIGPGRW